MDNYIIEGKSMIVINGQKLKELGKATGKTGADISRQFGLGEGNFTQACSRGKINRAFARFIEKEYGIPIDAYAVKIEDPKDELPKLTPAEELSNMWQQEICGQIMELKTEIEDVKARLENLANIRFGANGQDSAISMTKEELQNVIYRAVYSAVLHAWETPEEK